jgi:NADPH:quinone reductase-like Zn-dependent oxidoreductase
VFFWGAVQRSAKILSPAQQARFVMVRPMGADLGFLGQLADRGQLRPNIGRTFPLDRAADAHELSEHGHARGKIVLEI